MRLPWRTKGRQLPPRAVTGRLAGQQPGGGGDQRSAGGAAGAAAVGAGAGAGAEPHPGAGHLPRPGLGGEGVCTCWALSRLLECPPLRQWELLCLGGATCQQLRATEMSDCDVGTCHCLAGVQGMQQQRATRAMTPVPCSAAGLCADGAAAAGGGAGCAGAGAGRAAAVQGAVRAGRSG